MALSWSERRSSIMTRRFIGILTAIALCSIAGGAIANSQEDEVCIDECKAIHQECVDYCAEHTNPLECDDECRDEQTDCAQECRN
jgi:hypothetical protein